MIGKMSYIGPFESFIQFPNWGKAKSRDSFPCQRENLGVCLQSLRNLDWNEQRSLLWEQLEKVLMILFVLNQSESSLSRKGDREEAERSWPIK